jgi:hypothetical protein
MRVLMVLAIIFSNMVAAPHFSRAANGCAQENPEYIRVFMIHHKGSSQPAEVLKMRFKSYVGRVMASGAWPAYKPGASLRAGAMVIKQRAHWFVCHPQEGYVFRGERYDIHNGSARAALPPSADDGQLLRRGVYVHSNIREAVNDVWQYFLRKDDQMAKPQWAGDGGRCGQVTTGNRLYEDGATDCARRGYRWKRILRVYLNARLTT